MCPFSGASDFESYFWTSCLVSPGHVERKIFLIAFVMIDVHGLEKSDQVIF